MGMELIYRVKVDDKLTTFIEFPVSTPTNVTKQVLRAKTTEERIEILYQTMNLDTHTLNEIEDMLNKENIVLTEI